MFCIPSRIPSRNPIPLLLWDPPPLPRAKHLQPHFFHLRLHLYLYLHLSLSLSYQKTNPNDDDVNNLSLDLVPHVRYPFCRSLDRCSSYARPLSRLSSYTFTTESRRAFGFELHQREHSCSSIPFTRSWAFYIAAAFGWLLVLLIIILSLDSSRTLEFPASLPHQNIHNGQGINTPGGCGHNVHRSG